MMKKLRRVVQGTDPPAGRAFDLIIMILIVISLVSFSIETLPGLSENLQVVLNAINAATVVAFTVEYVLRILTAERPRKFIFSFLGFIDLLAILPFYLTTGLDLRGLRVVRLLRVFRLLKLARYSRAVQRFVIAFKLAREEFVLFFSVAGALMYFAAVGVYYFERDAQPEAFASVFHALWWAVATLTTVGYGDVYPMTVGGKIFTAAILAIGLGIVAVPAGILATALGEAKRLDEESASLWVPGPTTFANLCWWACLQSVGGLSSSASCRSVS